MLRGEGRECDGEAQFSIAAGSLRAERQPAMMGADESMTSIPKPKLAAEYRRPEQRDIQ